MDAETLVETWIELRQRGRFQIEALEILREEIASSTELPSEEKEYLTTLLTHSEFVEQKDLEDAFDILSKREDFQETFADIVGKHLAGNRKR